MLRTFRYITLFIVAMAALYMGNTLAQTPDLAPTEIATDVANSTAEPEPTAPPDDTIILEPDGTISIPVEPKDNSGTVAIIISLIVALLTFASNTATVWVVLRRFLPAMPIMLTLAEMLTSWTPGKADDAEVKKWRDWYNTTNPEGVAAKVAASKLAQSAAASQNPPQYKSFTSPSAPSGGQVPDEPGFG